MQRIYYSPHYFAELAAADGSAHVMPIHKFALVREGIGASGLPCTFEPVVPATDEDLLRVHAPDYIRAVATGEPRSLAESQKFPWTAQLASAVRWTNGG